jgi:hypothetical protein
MLLVFKFKFDSAGFPRCSAMATVHSGDSEVDVSLESDGPNAQSGFGHSDGCNAQPDGCNAQLDDDNATTDDDMTDVANTDDELGMSRPGTGIIVNHFAVYPLLTVWPNGKPEGRGKRSLKKVYAKIAPRLLWLRESCGVYDFNELPEENVIADIASAINSLRGRRCKTMRLLDVTGQPLPLHGSILVRGHRMDIIQKAWPIFIEATLPNIRWLVRNLKHDMVKEGPRFSVSQLKTDSDSGLASSSARAMRKDVNAMAWGIVYSSKLRFCIRPMKVKCCTRLAWQCQKTQLETTKNAQNMNMTRMSACFLQLVRPYLHAW